MQLLPIDEVLPELTATLRRTNSVVLEAPTGAGKTTRVPPALLDDAQGLIVMLEPRRLAARAAARRMAEERGESLGHTVGYHVRFDRVAGPSTRILVVTEGLLLRMLQDDPALERVSVVIFDEFHERSLDTDLGLGLVRLVQQTLRPELRIVVMSATLSGQTISEYLGNCRIVRSEGRRFPVEIQYAPRPTMKSWPQAAADAVGDTLRQTPGDILIFLPGIREIRETARNLERLAESRDLEVALLYGDLPADQQDAVLRPGSRRKIVLATNVAETSVTVEGVTAVIDTGLARQLIYDPDLGLDRLDTVAISRASADQRAGRAGRTQPGLCVRLWSEAYHASRTEYTAPEISRVDLAGALLGVWSLGEKDLVWLDPPATDRVENAKLVLRLLGAIDDEGITQLGSDLARLPVHPRLGRLLLEGERLGHPRTAALAAALLSDRDPIERKGKAKHSSRSDLLDRVDLLEAFARRESPGGIDAVRAQFTLRIASQLERLLDSTSHPEMMPRDEALLRSVLAAFPDRLVKRRTPGGPKGYMVGGKGVRLADTSAVRDGELFVALDVDGAQAEALVRLASLVQRDWLETRTRDFVTFDETSQKAVGRRQVVFEDLVLEEMPAQADADEASKVLAEAALARWATLVPKADTPAGSFLTRTRWLAEMVPELDLPRFDDDDLREILTWLAQGKRSLADLRGADWLSLFSGRLTHQQRQALEREAPERIEVPSGNTHALVYEPGKAPVLAVRIQELFGLTETPRLARGRVKVLLHLLAPNYRPQQVTDDLASFWVNTYPQVRKDLRGRYPKHKWPENPLERD